MSAGFAALNTGLNASPISGCALANSTTFSRDGGRGDSTSLAMALSLELRVSITGKSASIG